MTYHVILFIIGTTPAYNTYPCQTGPGSSGFSEDPDCWVRRQAQRQFLRVCFVLSVNIYHASVVLTDSQLDQFTQSALINCT